MNSVGYDTDFVAHIHCHHIYIYYAMYRSQILCEREKSSNYQDGMEKKKNETFMPFNAGTSKVLKHLSFSVIIYFMLKCALMKGEIEMFDSPKWEKVWEKKIAC